VLVWLCLKCYHRKDDERREQKSIGLFLILAMAALLFFPAWTLNYWQAWVFLAVFGGSGLETTVYLMKNDPKLLERRTQGGPTSENETSQKVIQSITAIAFVALLVVSALDHRFAWSPVPRYVPLVGDALILFGMFIIFFVFKQNSFASSTIEVAPGQEAITTGLYALVRHPMYMGAFFYLVGIPISLDSWRGLFMIVLMMPALIWRLFDEEKFLANNLTGYLEYQNKVRYRLVPFIW
jgi:protein-S-isoprenylcysteine O-methyltransferase Ste14